MGSAGTAIIYVLIAAAICLPPLLALRLFYRSFRRAQHRAIPAGRFRVAWIAALVGFLYNCGAVIGTFRLLAAGGTVEFTLWHGLAVAVAWVAFWVWLFMAVALGRDLGRTHGLR